MIAVNDAWDEGFFSGLVKNDDRDGDGYSNGTEVPTGSDQLDALSHRSLCKMESPRRKRIIHYLVAQRRMAT